MVGYSHLSGLKPTQPQDGGAPRPDDIMEVWVSPTSLRTDPDSTSEKIRDLAIGTRVKVISPVKQRWIHIEVLISKGQIESPKSNAQVIQAIEVRGTVSYLQPETRLWLAVRKGPLIWPKVPYNVEVREGRWSAIVYEGDKEDKGTPPGGEFELVLLEVGSAGNNEIEEWNRIGAATSHFPGFGSI
jgi:hypothetical protein